MRRPVATTLLVLAIAVVRRTGAAPDVVRHLDDLDPRADDLVRARRRLALGGARGVYLSDGGLDRAVGNRCVELSTAVDQQTAHLVVIHAFRIPQSARAQVLRDSGAQPLRITAIYLRLPLLPRRDDGGAGCGNIASVVVLVVSYALACELIQQSLEFVGGHGLLLQSWYLPPHCAQRSFGVHVLPCAPPVPMLMLSI